MNSLIGLVAIGLPSSVLVPLQWYYPLEQILSTILFRPG
jgi:hypothetical protein